MTTNILANGCSFTFGHGSIQYPDTGETMPPRTWVWPFALERRDPNIKCNNISIGGASNNRILRTTIDSIEKETPDAVIVQWTSPFRSEWYDEFWETFYTLVPGNVTDEMQRNIQALKMFGEPCVFIPVPKLKNYGPHTEYFEKVTTASQHYQAYIENHTNAIIDFCKDVLVLQSYLDKKKIPYLFSGMSNSCMLGRKDGPDIWSILDWANEKPIDYIIQLRKEINPEKWTHYAFSRMMADNIVSKEPYDPHPNNLGHELIARELHKEIVRRDLLKDN